MSALPPETQIPTSSNLGGGVAGSADNLVQRIAQGAHETVDRLAPRAAQTVERLSSTVTQAQSKLHESADRAVAMGSEWTESARTTVRDYPLAAVAVGFAVGWLLGRLGR